MPCLIALKEAFGNALRITLNADYSVTGQRRMSTLAAIAGKTAIPLLATNNVLYHRPQRHRLQDVLTSIREHLTLDEAGTLLYPNAERHMKPGAEIARLLASFPEAVTETQNLFSELSFSLDELRYQYPDETPESGLSPKAELRRLAYEGAKKRYNGSIPQKITSQIEHELKLIAQL